MLFRSGDAVGGQGKDLNTLSCGQVDGPQECPLDSSPAPREPGAGSQQLQVRPFAGGLISGPGRLFVSFPSVRAAPREWCAAPRPATDATPPRASAALAATDVGRLVLPRPTASAGGHRDEAPPGASISGRLQPATAAVEASSVLRKDAPLNRWRPHGRYRHRWSIRHSFGGVKKPGHRDTMRWRAVETRLDGGEA